MSRPHSRASRLTLFFLVALVAVVADLATKHWIFAKLGRPGEQGVWWQIEDVFGQQTSLNQGAAFGLGQGQIPLFVALSGIALFGIVWWVASDVSRSFFLPTTLGMIVGGILGNLWDRLGLHGMTWTQFDADVWSCSQELVGQPMYAVRDWILVLIGDYHWPNFNIADSCLVCGCILVGGYALLAPTAPRLPGLGVSSESDAGSADAVESSDDSSSAK